jgi:hypothetical protein
VSASVLEPVIALIEKFLEGSAAVVASNGFVKVPPDPFHRIGFRRVLSCQRGACGIDKPRVTKFAAGFLNAVRLVGAPATGGIGDAEGAEVSRPPVNYRPLRWHRSSAVTAVMKDGRQGGRNCSSAGAVARRGLSLLAFACAGWHPTWAKN